MKKTRRRGKVSCQPRISSPRPTGVSLSFLSKILTEASHHQSSMVSTRSQRRSARLQALRSPESHKPSSIASNARITLSQRPERRRPRYKASSRIARSPHNQLKPRPLRTPRISLPQIKYNALVATPDAPLSFRLLELPRELRDLILEQLILHEEMPLPENLHKFTTHIRCISLMARYAPRKRYPRNILLVNRQLHDEFIDVIGALHNYAFNSSLTLRAGGTTLRPDKRPSALETQAGGLSVRSSSARLGRFRSGLSHFASISVLSSR
jgi:hypothetical protein